MIHKSLLIILSLGLLLSCSDGENKKVSKQTIYSELNDETSFKKGNNSNSRNCVDLINSINRRINKLKINDIVTFFNVRCDSLNNQESLEKYNNLVFELLLRYPNEVANGLKDSSINIENIIYQIKHQYDKKGTIDYLILLVENYGELKNEYPAIQRVYSVLKEVLAKQSVFNNKLNFSLEAFTKNSSANSSDPDTTKCIDWNLTKDEIKDIIMGMNQISGIELNQLYSVLKCQYTGTIIQGENKFSFSINGGSYLEIYNDSIQLSYGDTNAKFRNKFIESVWNPENEN